MRFLAAEITDRTSHFVLLREFFIHINWAAMSRNCWDAGIKEPIDIEQMSEAKIFLWFIYPILQAGAEQ
jgi:hypothetical protein